MLKNACVLINCYIFPFQNLHAENIKAQLIEKNPSNHDTNICFLKFVGHRKLIEFSAKYFGACFELLTKCGWIMPLYPQARGDLKIQRFLGII